MDRKIIMRTALFCVRPTIGEETYFLAWHTRRGSPELVESVIGLFNKGYELPSTYKEAKQLALNCGISNYKIVRFSRPFKVGGKPFLEMQGSEEEDKE